MFRFYQIFEKYGTWIGTNHYYFKNGEIYFNLGIRNFFDTFFCLYSKQRSNIKKFSSMIENFHNIQNKKVKYMFVNVIRTKYIFKDFSNVFCYLDEIKKFDKNKCLLFYIKNHMWKLENNHDNGWMNGRNLEILKNYIDQI